MHPSCWVSIVCPLVLKKGAVTADKGLPGTGHEGTWRQPTAEWGRSDAEGRVWEKKDISADVECSDTS